MAIAVRTVALPVKGGQVAFVVASIVLSVITIVAILWKHYRRAKKVFKEDVILALGTAIALVLSVGFTIGVFFGLGKTNAVLSNSGNRDKVHTASAVATYAYIAASFLIRTSFLVLYLQLDHRRPAIVRGMIVALIALVFAQACSLFIGSTFSCAPPVYIWTNNEARTGECWSPHSIQVFLNVSGVISSVTDATILLVPVCISHGWKTLKARPRISFALFAIVALVIAAGCLRCYNCWYLVDSTEPYRKIAIAGMWAQVEVHLAILCCTASTLISTRKMDRTHDCEATDLVPGSVPNTEAAGEKYDLKGTLETPRVRVSFLIPGQSLEPLRPSHSSQGESRPRVHISIPDSPTLPILSDDTSEHSHREQDRSVSPSEDGDSDGDSSSLSSLIGSHRTVPSGEFGATQPCLPATSSGPNFSRLSTGGRSYVASAVPILRSKASLYRASTTTPFERVLISRTMQRAQSFPINTQCENFVRDSPSLTRFPVKPQDAAATPVNGAKSSSTRHTTKMEPAAPPPVLVKSDNNMPSFRRGSAKGKHTALSSQTTTDSPSTPKAIAPPRKIHRSDSSLFMVYPSIEARLKGQEPWIYDGSGKIIVPPRRANSD